MTDRELIHSRFSRNVGNMTKNQRHSPESNQQDHSHPAEGTVHIPHERVIDLIYTPLLLLAIPFYLYQGWKRTRSFTELFNTLLRKCGRQPSASKESCIWIHAASVGEVNSLPPLINQLLEHDTFQEHSLMITTNTLSGYNTAVSSLPGSVTVCHAPLDLSWIVHHMFDLCSPEMLILVEQELWPNMCRIAHQRNVPLMIVNGRISQRSADRIEAFPSSIRRTLTESLQSVLVQNQTYQRRFHQLGVSPSKIHVPGNMKYDAVQQNLPSSSQIQKLREELQIQENEGVLVAGSIHPPEHNLLFRCYKKLQQQDDWPFETLRLILAPRHPEKAPAMYEELQTPSFSISRYQQLQDQNEEPSDIILIDVIGILTALYALADVVFIGGSFIEHGGQNVLEPAALGKPILIGPSYYNFEEEVQFLQSAEGLSVTQNENELFHVLDTLFSSPEEAERMGRNAEQELRTHMGATRKTVEHLQTFLPSDEDPSLPSRS